MNLIKIPCALSGFTQVKGAEKAPDKIVYALKSFFANESGKQLVYSVDEVQINPTNVSESFENIQKKILEVKDNFIVLGGDHSITYSVLKSFAKHHPDFALIIFDAHPDLMQSFAPATHENYLRVLIEEGIVNSANIVLIGLRNWDTEECNFLEKNKIKYFTMKKISHEEIEDICDSVMEFANSFPAMYLSIDIDAIDCAFAPGTGYPEPAGLTSRELIYFVQRLVLLKNFKAADLVEVNPDKDVNEMTILLGAKIIGEML